MNKYEVIIYWSDEDQSFIAEVPDFPAAPLTIRLRKPRSPTRRKQSAFA
jgi:hypothetical protein